MCDLCDQAAIAPHGIYHADCVACAVREVRSIGNRGHQEQIIWRYVSFGVVTREEILAGLASL